MSGAGAPLAAEGLVWGYPGRRLGGPLDLAVGAGEALALVGPNGAGKTTLLRTLAGLLPPLEGRVLLGGEEPRRLPAARRARLVSVLSQDLREDDAITVRELVELGRTPHLGLWGHLAASDEEAIAGALTLCGLGELAGRRLGELSGGERQRARIAMTVAQDAPLLLLDEPVAHLDLRHRHELFEQLRQLREARALAVGLVLHELADAYREAARVLVLSDGRAEEIGASDPTRLARLARAFGVPESRISL